MYVSKYVAKKQCCKKGTLPISNKTHQVANIIPYAYWQQRQQNSGAVGKVKILGSKQKQIIQKEVVLIDPSFPQAFKYLVSFELEHLPSTHIFKNVYVKIIKAFMEMLIKHNYCIKLQLSS